MNEPKSIREYLMSGMLILAGLLLMYLPLVSDVLAYIPYVLFRCSGDMHLYDTRLGGPMMHLAGCKVLPFFSEKLVAVMRTWGFLIHPPMGLGILAYCGFRRTLPRFVKILLVLASCPPVVLVLSHFISPLAIFVLLGAGLIALATPYLAAVLNIALSYVVVKFINVSRPLKIALFLVLSILLTLNVRIPGIATDLFYAATKGERVRIDRQVVLPRDEPLALIQNVDAIEYRANPMSTYTMVADFFVHGPHVERPALTNIRIEDHLLSKGFPLDRKGTAQTKLVVEARDNGGTTDLTLSVVSGGVETARYENRLRKSYPLENHGNLARYKDKDSLGNEIIRFTLASFQDSAWNKIAVALLEDKDRHRHKPILEFVDRALEINRQVLPAMRISEAKIAETDKVEDALPVKKLFGEFRDYHATLLSGCDGETTGTKVIMPFPDDHYLIFSSGKNERKVYFKQPIVTDNPSATLPAYMPKKVICDGDEVIVFLMPLSMRCVTAVRYSLNGDCLGVHEMTLPKIEWGKGMGKTVVVDFKKLPNSYEFTLLNIPEESLKRIARSEYFYYFTPSDLRNGVASAYRISFEK